MPARTKHVCKAVLGDPASLARTLRTPLRVRRCASGHPHQKNAVNRTNNPRMITSCVFVVVEGVSGVGVWLLLRLWFVFVGFP